MRSVNGLMAETYMLRFYLFLKRNVYVLFILRIYVLCSCIWGKWESSWLRRTSPNNSRIDLILTCLWCWILTFPPREGSSEHLLGLHRTDVWSCSLDLPLDPASGFCSLGWAYCPPGWYQCLLPYAPSYSHPEYLQSALYPRPHSFAAAVQVFLSPSPSVLASTSCEVMSNSGQY